MSSRTENTCRKYICDQQPEAVFSVSQQRTDALPCTISQSAVDLTLAALQENTPK